MKHIKQILFSLITLSTSLNAVIPEMEIWADKDNQRFLYLLKDIHVDYKGAKNTIKQQQDILWALQQHKNTSFIIAEDSISLFRQFMIEHQLKTTGSTTITFPISLQKHINNRDWSKYKVEEAPAETEKQQLYSATPLEFLAHFCQNAGINTFNVECDTMIDAYKYDAYENQPEHQQAQQIVHDTLSAYINELKNNSSLTPYCNLLDQKLEYLQLGIGNSDQDTFYAVAMSIRWVLLEARALYQLNAWKEMKHGYVVTGADHIAAIKQNLPLLGYRHIKTIGTPLATYITEVVDKEKNIVKIKEDIETPYNVLASNPLDLHKTFTEIFNEKKPFWQKAITYVAGMWMKIR